MDEGVGGASPGRDRALSKSDSIAVGIVVAVVGIAIVAVAFVGSAERFQSPRWVVAAAGGAFLFFGSWTCVVYLLGFDPKRPDDTLPSPALQLLFFVPGFLLFAAPFHWIAFGPGRRQFSGSLSLPFVSVTEVPGGEIGGRIMFGIGALLVDAILVGTVVKLVQRMPRGGRGGSSSVLQ